MAIIKIDNFGGELPRVSPRVLPVGAAQINSNLLATSSEFRPLQEDSAVAMGASNAKTLYRLSRDAIGALRTGDATGWIAETADKNYVKGQINDDATERTYVTFNAGSAAPRVIDALGANRLLGVPAPASATATLNQVKSFTREDAGIWSEKTLIPGMEAAILASLVPSGERTYMTLDSVPIAGPYETHGLWWINAGDTDFWNLRFAVDQSVGIANGLNDPRITPELANASSSLIVRISCMPSWSAVDNLTLLKSGLRALVDPVTSEQLMSEALVDDFAAQMVERFDPAGDSLKSTRDTLDAVVREFKAACDFVLLPTVADPVQPEEPTTPYYVSGQDIEGVNAVMSPDWVDYKTLLGTWMATVADNEKNEIATTGQKAARISKIVDMQAQAKRMVQEIEAAYRDRVSALTTDFEAFVSGRGYDFNQGTDESSNVVQIDPDRIIDTRFYFATFTTDWGEESAPSPISGLLEVDQYSNTTITLSSPPAGRNVAQWTLYRSAVGNTSTAFQRVASGNIATLVYTDTMKLEELGEVCPTVTWAEPPFRIDSAASTDSNLVAKGTDPHLRGLVGMPNGVMAGFIDNFIAFCDPYHPYAWPVEYQIPLQFEVVGLGVFGQSLFVGTYANPYIISGSDSASMSSQKLDDAQACLSARSIAAAAGGVLYASPDGICFASLNGVEVITTALFAREDWQALEPESIRALMFEGVYYFWYAGNGGGCYALDTVAKKLTRVDMLVGAVFADSLTDAVYYTQGTQIKRAFSTGRRTGVWKSPLVVLPAQTPFAWLQVDADYNFGKTVQIKWYGDGVLRHTATLSSIRPVRLPTGRWLEHEVEVTSTARVTKVMLAGHTLELQAT
jgi:hypothetical protein